MRLVPPPPALPSREENKEREGVGDVTAPSLISRHFIGEIEYLYC